MRNLFWIACLSTFSIQALGADCIYYVNSDRTGGQQELTAPVQKHELDSNWNDIISGIWVRSGYYSLATSDLLFKGSKNYFYGSGLTFLKNTWSFDKGSALDGGFYFDLNPLGLNDSMTSILCLKA